MTANYELSRSNTDNLPWRIQIKLPKKGKSFCCIFFDWFLTQWLATTSYLVAIETNYHYQFKSNYLKNEDLFTAFSWTFWYLHEIYNLLKKMSLIGQLFLELLTPKSGVIEMHNRACFWKPFGSECLTYAQKRLKSAENYFYPTF